MADPQASVPLPLIRPPGSKAILQRGPLQRGRITHHIGPICDTEQPPLSERGDGHAIRCHLADDALGGARVSRDVVGIGTVAPPSAADMSAS